MRAAVVVIILFSLMVRASPILMQENTAAEVDLSPVVVADTQTILLTSSVHGYDYQLSVALPASYTTSDQSYPVLYLLDPFVSFLSVTEFVRLLASFEELPELIVVGIGYPSDEPEGVFALRERDYLRAQDDFLEFIRDELIPVVDSTYRTDPTDRALVGFSYGGELAFHTLVTQPELFNRYVAIDASYAELTLVFSGDDTAFRERLAGLNIKLFFASAGTEFLNTLIQNQAYEELEATGFPLGAVSHTAALHLSLPAGILAVYAR